jgi:hypothetical protein
LAKANKRLPQGNITKIIMAVGMIKIIHSLKTGAVLAALLTTGMAGGNMQKQDLAVHCKNERITKTLSVNSWIIVVIR